jgi:two-component system sensor histidine kinase TctE
MLTWHAWLLRARSLRRFLLVWLLGGLWGLVGGITLVLYLATAVQTAEAQDERLRSAIAEVVQSRSSGSMAEPRHAVHSRSGVLSGAEPSFMPTHYRVSDMNGEWLAGDRGLAAYPWSASLASAGTPELYVTHLHGTLVRAAAAVRHVSRAPDDAASVMVQSAEPLALRFPSLRDLPREPLLWVYALAAAMTLVAASGVALALRWLDRAREALGSPQTDVAAYDGPAELLPAVERMHGLHRRQREWVGQQRRFLADASHQLRTPMSVLRTQLQSAIAGDVPAAEVLPQMLHTVDRASGMANQLLSLTKLEQIKRAGQLQPVALWGVAREAVMELSPLIAAKRLDFALEGEEGAQAPADAVMLGELVRNLLANAIAHTQAAGRLGVLLRTYAGVTELVVWDEGPGLDDEIRPRLFQPFSSAKGGVGLGLSICRQIADAMGASMELFNRIEGDKVIGVDAVVTWGQGP